ncbi:MAG: TrmB family transcriptional regulator [Chloroflexota bacterium]
MNDATAGRLSRLGLTGYEARVYVALADRDSYSAGEVARRAGVPRQRIYDVLASLVDKGLASERPGDPAKYSAAEPGLAIGGLIEARRQHLAGLESDAEALIAALVPAYRAGQRHTDPLDYIEVLREPGAIAARFDELQEAVQFEILVFNKPPYARQPQENRTGLRLARSGQAQGIYEFSLFEDREASEGVRQFIAEGERARFVPELPLKLVIIDETLVMFGMQDPVADQPGLTIMVVEHPALAILLKTAFQAYWEKGLTYEEARAHRVAEPV